MDKKDMLFLALGCYTYIKLTSQGLKRQLTIHDSSKFNVAQMPANQGNSITVKLEQRFQR